VLTVAELAADLVGRDQFTARERGPCLGNCLLLFGAGRLVVERCGC
jgi:hypothetical protein